MASELDCNCRIKYFSDVCSLELTWRFPFDGKLKTSLETKHFFMKVGFD